jgi:hypothetical protein
VNAYKPINVDFAQVETYSVTAHKLESFNWWTGLATAEKHTYYSVHEDRFHFSSFEHHPTKYEFVPYFKVYYQEDAFKVRISRNVVSLFDILATIGGFLEIITIFTVFLASFYSNFAYE